MRIIYLTLALFVLLNIGANCRTPPVEERDCTPASAGLAVCQGETTPQS